MQYMKFDDRDKAALRTLDGSFTFSSDGTTATSSCSTHTARNESLLKKQARRQHHCEMMDAFVAWLDDYGPLWRQHEGEHASGHYASHRLRQGRSNTF
jgi:hypothetical protein